MSEPQVELLRQFISLCKADPSILHQPNMRFYREYLESLGATVPPPKPSSPSNKMSGGDGDADQSAKAERQSPPAEPEAGFNEPEPILDESGLVEPDVDDPLPMGDPKVEASEADLEKANEERDAGAAAFADGDFQSAVEHFTVAIISNPGSAILHAKRANALLKLGKPVAAIRDCDHAIAINADSAAGYKFRGRANRLLGNWIQSHKDLATACKLDWDETANEWLKEVEPNAKKLLEYQRSKERWHAEKELKERRERVERAREANRQAADEGAETGDGEGFGLGGFNELFKELADDPDLLQMLKEDPSLMPKLMQIMQNPGNIAKHMGDPGVQKLLQKLGSRFGAPPPPESFASRGDNAPEGASHSTKMPSTMDDVD